MWSFRKKNTNVYVSLIRNDKHLTLNKIICPNKTAKIYCILERYLWLWFYWIAIIQIDMGIKIVRNNHKSASRRLPRSYLFITCGSKRDVSMLYGPSELRQDLCSQKTFITRHQFLKTRVTRHRRKQTHEFKTTVNVYAQWVGCAHYMNQTRFLVACRHNKEVLRLHRKLWILLISKIDTGFSGTCFISVSRRWIENITYMCQNIAYLKNKTNFIIRFVFTEQLIISIMNYIC